MENNFYSKVKLPVIKATQAINFPLLWIICFFGFVYSLISLVPHFTFQSTAWDLGIYNQTIWQYSRLIVAENTISHISTPLSDHFELTLALFAPLYYIFGSYTLLVVQITAVLLGGGWRL